MPDSPPISTVLLVAATLLDGRKHLLHGVAAAEDVGKFVPAVERALQQQIFLLQAARLEVLPDLQPQLVHAERLDEVIDGAEPHRLDRGVGRRETPSS